jgi:CRISPR-associated protein Cmr2
MNHLFLLSIGPVQSFITQARKTQDLFAGSRLLSDLSKAAYDLLGELAQKQGGSCHSIFPSFAGNSHPNRFMAEIKGLNKTQLNKIGVDLETNLRAKFIQLGHDAWKELHPSAGLQKSVEKQLTQHLEVYWMALECANDADFAAQSARLNAFLASVKNTRSFEQLDEPGARKCSVDGMRNALIYQRNAGGGKPNYLQNDALELNPLRYFFVQPGEGLSAVSLLKRKYLDENFPSTARIALLNDLKDKEDTAAFRSFKTLVQNTSNRALEHWDEQLLYEENITPAYFYKQGLGGVDESGKAFIEGFNVKVEFNKLLDKLGSFTPSYYAVLVYDGDSMGKWFEGKYLQNVADLRPFHAKLTQLLAKFGQWSSDYLNESKWNGCTVYTGGDDFLGLVNLHSLLEVLKTLRCEFDQQVNQQLQSAFALNEGVRFSFSAGIAIGHYKQPLNLVLEEARQAEKLAKKGHKDEFAISLMRHSGGTTRMVLPFQLIGEKCEKIEAMRVVIEAMRAEQYSNAFIHQLYSETRLWDEQASNLEMFKLELRRLALRAKNLPTQELKFDAMWNALQALLPSTSLEAPNGWMEAVHNTLAICDFLYRTTKKSQTIQAEINA